MYNNFFDVFIKLRGTKANIFGRGLITHEDPDDCGQGGNADSLKTGNLAKFQTEFDSEFNSN